MSQNLPGNEGEPSAVPQQDATAPAAETAPPAAQAPPAPPAAPAAPPAPPAAPAYGAPAYGAPAGAGADQPKGLAIAAMVLGISGIVGAWIPVISWFAFPAAIVGLILGIIALKKGQPRGMALTGIILGAVAVVLSAILLVIGVVALAALGALAQ